MRRMGFEGATRRWPERRRLLEWRRRLQRPPRGGGDARPGTQARAACSAAPGKSQRVYRCALAALPGVPGPVGRTGLAAAAASAGEAEAAGPARNFAGS